MANKPQWCPHCIGMPRSYLFKNNTTLDGVRIPTWACVKCGGWWLRDKVRHEYVLGEAIHTQPNGRLDWDWAREKVLAAKKKLA